MKDLILVAIFFFFFFFLLLLFNFKAAGSLKLYKTNNKEENLERKRWPET